MNQNPALRPKTSDYVPDPNLYWPPNSDGTVLYPENHKEIYSSSLARVIRVFIAPGRAERPHTHPHPSVMFIDQPTTLIVFLVNSIGYETIVHRNVEPVAKPERPIIQRMDPEPYHYVQNTDKIPYLATRIELMFPNAYDPLHHSFEAHDIQLEEGGGILTQCLPFESFIIGNADTMIKVYMVFLNKKKLITPLDTLTNRAPIWVLLPFKQYAVSNESPGSTSAYHLEIIPDDTQTKDGYGKAFLDSHRLAKL